MTTVVVITSAGAKADHIVRRFQDLGWEVRLSDMGSHSTEDQVIDELWGADACIATMEPYTRRVIEALPNLKLIQRTGVGYDAVDVDAATEHGVIVSTTPGSNHKSVADYAVMSMLALTRKLLDSHALLHGEGRWARPPSHDFFGSTVGVIGVGRIGKEVVQRVLAFECTVLGNDIVQDQAFAARTGLRYVPLDDLLEQSDFVTVHVPSTPETHHLIGERELSLMKPTAILVNSARGPLVDAEAVYRALKENRIAGAALDVFHREPLDPDTSLRELDNIILTSHIAGVTAEASARGGEMAAENVCRVLQGQPPVSLINPEVLQR